MGASPALPAPLREQQPLKGPPAPDSTTTEGAGLSPLQPAKPTVPVIPCLARLSRRPRHRRIRPAYQQAKITLETQTRVTRRQLLAEEAGSGATPAEPGSVAAAQPLPPLPGGPRRGSPPATAGRLQSRALARCGTGPRPSPAPRPGRPARGRRPCGALSGRQDPLPRERPPSRPAAAASALGPGAR